MYEDWDLIIASFLSQYGLRIRTKEFLTVSWDEFRSLLAGISPETVLGRVVAIRSETDRKVIKNFTIDQKRIYDSWKNRGIDTMTKDGYDQQMAALEEMMARLCG